MNVRSGIPSPWILIGFLYRGTLVEWSYAIAAEVAASGATCMRFQSQDVDWERRLVHGEFWQGNAWERRWSRFPDAIRNFEFPVEGERILDLVPFTLGRHYKKNEQLMLLARELSTAAYVPATIDIGDRTPLLPYVERWGAAILKPSRGRLGQGIVFVRKTDSGFDIEEEGSRRSVSYEDGLVFLEQFAASAGRNYVLQQFAAGTGPEGRYISIRIIMQKSGDGDWRHCSYPLALIAKSGSVVVNRDRGATNIQLRPILQERFGDGATAVLERLLSAAVAVARVLDDANASRCDEFALDMAIDNNGRPWLHEANLRGGFWFLEEDVSLYRSAGANAVRIARRAVGGGHPDFAAVAEFSAARLRRNSQWAAKKRFPPLPAVGIGVDFPRIAADTPMAFAKAVETRPCAISLSTSASFGTVAATIGRSIEMLREQTPHLELPPMIVSAGILYHDPADDRAPWHWMRDELVRPGIVDEVDLRIGSSISPVFLARSIDRHIRTLWLDRIDMFVIDGVHLQIAQRSDWRARWLNACRCMVQECAAGRISVWGISLPLDFVLSGCAELSLLCLPALSDARYRPSHLLVHLELPCTEAKIDALIEMTASLELQLVVKIAMQKARSIAWNVRHRAFDPELTGTLCKRLTVSNIAILLPVVGEHDADAYSALAPSRLISTCTFDRKIFDAMTHVADNDVQTRQKQALSALGRFDQRQVFRLFVDGRFHKKYRGWRGYEENENGSVAGILAAYSLMIERFGEAACLSGNYLRQLHAACMSNVATRNKKSTPGELRYLDAGINLFGSNSTLASLEEIVAQRRGDGGWLFHTPGFQKTADEFTAEEILSILRKEGRLRFRMWYPNLSAEQSFKLNESPALSDYYEVKHFVQKCFAERVDHHVEAYNVEIAKARTDGERLVAISRVVRDIELLHPFPDGNGRTLVAVLMNHLLLFNGFLPAVLWDPNIDAELSVAEFADEIQRGIENTRLLLSNPDAELYGYSIAQASQEETKAFLKLSQGFATRLHALINRMEQADREGTELFLHLTPARLSAATGGVWFNADAQLRFESVGIASGGSPRQLLFLRERKNWLEEGLNPEEEISRALSAGVAAVVLDDSDIGKKLQIPAFFVPDVDAALHDAGAWARESVACKTIAVVGTALQDVAVSLLEQATAGQRNTFSAGAEPCKTPQVMAALASLCSTHEIALISVASTARPAVARHRLRAIAPDICFVSSSENTENADEKVFANMLASLAASGGSVRAGGFVIAHSGDRSFPELKRATEDLGPVPMQTFGELETDQGRLLEIDFDPQMRVFRLSALILGHRFDYSLASDRKEAPILSVGVLLALANLGVDIELAASAFAHG